MSWGGSEKNRWFQLDVSISMLWSFSGEKNSPEDDQNKPFYRNVACLCCDVRCHSSNEVAHHGVMFAKSSTDGHTFSIDCVNTIVSIYARQNDFNRLH